LRTEPKDVGRLMLRRAVKTGQLHLIAVLSNRDFEELLSSEHELLEFFTRINVEEPEEELAMAIIKQASNKLEQDYRVSIEERAIERALLLSSDYILNDNLP